MVQSDWTRYDMYAQRVRLLNFQEPGLLKTLYQSQQTYGALRAAKGCSLLPNLQDLVMNLV